MKLLKNVFHLVIYLTCVIHSSILLYNILNPEEPHIKSYEKDLSEIPFPLLFKMCIEAGVPYTQQDLMSFGYANLRRYYKGTSLYNKSMMGWAGHSNNGTSLGMEKGR